MSQEVTIRVLQLASNQSIALRDCNTAASIFRNDVTVLASTADIVIGRTALTHYFRRLFEDAGSPTIVRTIEVVRSDGTTAADYAAIEQNRTKPLFGELGAWRAGLAGFRLVLCSDSKKQQDNCV